ncbi:MAG: zinc ribbon domain-containing protein [Variovorax sp.]|nr:MAG: zinc ribbon domain-containing protein [Variovorax sp.]
MPTYDYDCGSCGPFTAVQKIALFDQPSPCPSCGAAGARSFGVPDSMRGGRRLAREGNRDAGSASQAGSYPRMRHAGGGCICCP